MLTCAHCIDLEPNNNTLTRYLSNLQNIPNHRFSQNQLDRCERQASIFPQNFGKYLLTCCRSSEEWALIEVAARASSVAYKDKNHPDDVRISNIDRDKKFMTMSVEEVAGSRVLVVSIRGTVTPADWMLNFNNAPTSSVKVSRGYLEGLYRLRMISYSVVTLPGTRDF